MYAEYIKQIIEQIGQDISQGPALKECEHVVDHDKPVRNNPDLCGYALALETLSTVLSFRQGRWSRS
jgi:hypothetical protein